MDNFEFIDSFKVAILNIVWTNFLTNRKSDVQEPIGMWRWAGDCAPFADGMNAVTLERGMLSFKVLVNGKAILFSIWIQTGDIRIGYRIPVELMQVNRTTAEQRLSAVYDGQPCARIVKDKDAVLFDMLFRDGFAGFDFMTHACLDYKVGRMDRMQIIADRIHDILVHTFIAVINETISINNFIVKDGFVGSFKSFNVEIDGNIREFSRWAENNQISILSHNPISVDGSSIHVMHCDVPTSVDISAAHSNTWRVARAIQIPPSN